MSLEKLTLVTGAGGFIGGWVAETLYLKNDPVRAGVRGWGGAARPARFRMEIAPCNILDPAELDEAMRDVTHVIHCAKGADETIEQGTRNVLEAAHKQGVERFIHISTTAVYGEQTGRIDETVSCRKSRDSYADNKVLAEEACWEYHDKGLPITIIRPPIVYGPFSKTFTVNLAYKLLAGNWGIFKGAADGICNLIYVSDLVDGILLAMGQDSAKGQVFILNGLERPTWNQYFERFNDALNLPPLHIYDMRNIQFKTMLMEPVRDTIKFARSRFEKLIKRLAAKQHSARRVMKFVETRMKTMPRIHDLRLYRRDALYLHNKAHQMLGYQPAVDLDEGLRMSVQWLEQIGMRQFQYTKGAR